MFLPWMQLQIDRPDLFSQWRVYANSKSEKVSLYQWINCFYEHLFNHMRIDVGTVVRFDEPERCIYRLSH